MNPRLHRLSMASATAPLAVSLALGILLAGAMPAQAADCTLLVSPVSVTAGNEIDVNVTLTSGASPAAIAFTIEYDNRKLSLLPASGAAVPVTVVTPSSYGSAVFADQTAGQIGVAVFPNAWSNESIGNGTIVQLKLVASRDAAGLAFVRIAPDPPPSASGRNEQLLTVDSGVENSGVSVTPLVPLVAVSPSSLDFGAVQQGTSIRKLISIADEGNAPATISSISIDGDPSFSIASSPPMPWLMGADDNTNVTVQFSAAGERSSRAMLQIATTSGDSIQVPVLGTSSADPTSVYGTRRLIPAVARLQESDGSSWASEITAFNSSDFEAGMQLTYRPSDGSAEAARQIQMAAHESRQFGDVISQLFGVTSGNGVLIVETSTPEVRIRSTTFHRLPAGGSLPETVPAVEWASLFHSGEQAILPILDFSSQSRTNVALVNLGTVATGFEVQLIRQDGTVAASRQISLAPKEIAGRVDLSGGSPLPDSALTVVISPITPNALYFAYASTVDLESGAPLYLPAR